MHGWGLYLCQVSKSSKSWLDWASTSMSQKSLKALKTGMTAQNLPSPDDDTTPLCTRMPTHQAGLFQPSCPEDAASRGRAQDQLGWEVNTTRRTDSSACREL